MMPAPMSWSEAFLAMFAMLIVLVFVLIYYCCIPVYRGMQRQKQREEEQQDWENDPRWNRDRFSFVPRRPKNFKQDKKYSRLAACSRTSSMRSDVHGNAEAPPPTAVNGKPPPAKPPKYSELYETGSTSNGSNLGTPPRYTSKPSSSAEASQENVAIPPPPKPKIIKPKKNRKPVPQPPAQAAAAAADTPTSAAAATDPKPADSNV